MSKYTKVEPWTSSDLKLHKLAVRKLETILKQSTHFISNKKSLNEEQLYYFIIDKMIKAGLTSLNNWAIVAYGSSADTPHYSFNPNNSKIIKTGQLLLLDIWGKVNHPDAPYADITHMYFIGKNPSEKYVILWNDLCASRDKALDQLRTSCSTKGSTLHNTARQCLDSCGYKGLFIHGLGHDLGHDRVHGPGISLSPKFPCPLLPMRGYTIEPGIYKKGEYGLRSEINFFLNKNSKVLLTTRIQKKLECIYV